MKKIYDIIGDILKRFKQVIIGKNSANTVVVRNLAIGMPAGASDFKKYEAWSKYYIQTSKRKAVVKE